MQRGLQDLYGLMSFLQLSPMDDKCIWDYLVGRPLSSSDGSSGDGTNGGGGGSGSSGESNSNCSATAMAVATSADGMRVLQSLLRLVMMRPTAPERHRFAPFCTAWRSFKILFCICRCCGPR